MQRVSMATIAAKAGVSKNAVSLALRGDPQIPEATRLRIEKIAAALGYTKNPVVAELMSELHKGGHPGYRRTLALLNAYPTASAFRSHPTIPAYVAGAQARAAFHGYTLDEFWLHDPELDGARLNRILRARGIRGALVVGMMNENRLPERFAPTWETLSCVVTGVRTHEPTLPFCCVDHHALVLEAMKRVIALGYRRPALVIEARIDALVERRFSAGMWVGQQALPARSRLPGFYDVDAARKDPRRFHAWLTRHEPDVLLTLYTTVKTWVEDAGLRVPDDIGLVQLERRPKSADWAGMDQHNDRAGAAGIDLLVAMLHRRESGTDAEPRATLIGGTWVPGVTVRAQPSELASTS
ncbi:MAG TPA: LacI family DNA-binding transcriptional regulator [Chthoniobacterales bacterium]|jgi:LacI family transcriptional regulator